MQIFITAVQLLSEIRLIVIGRSIDVDKRRFLIVPFKLVLNPLYLQTSGNVTYEIYCSEIRV